MAQDDPGTATRGGTDPVRIGRYSVLGVLGRGGMANVFRAVLDGPMGFRKEVALKQIRQDVVENNPMFVQALVNEALLGGHLRHPNVVETYEFQEAAGTFFIAMEYVRGLTLTTVLKGCSARGVLLPVPVVLDIVDQLCSGLQYAHTAVDDSGTPLNLVHRDLKPANIILSRSGTAKIMDFGIAKTPTNLYQTVETGTAKGTPYYMSPEQIQGQDALDARSDLFALGSLLFELTTGERLFREKEFAALYMAIVQGGAEARLGLLDAHLDGLEAVARRCLALDREDRFGSAAEVQRALRKLRRSTWDDAPSLRDFMQGLMASAQHPDGTDPSLASFDLTRLMEDGASLEESSRWPAFVDALGKTVEDDPVAASLQPSQGDALRRLKATVSLARRPASLGRETKLLLSDQTASGSRPARLSGRLVIALLVAVGLGAAAAFLFLPGGPQSVATSAPSAELQTPPAPSPTPQLAPPPPIAVSSATPTAEPLAQSTPSPASTPAATPAPSPTPEPAPSPTPEPAPSPAASDPNALVKVVMNTLPWSQVQRQGVPLGKTPLTTVLAPGVHEFVAVDPASGASHTFELTLRGDETPQTLCWDFKKEAPCPRR